MLLTSRHDSYTPVILIDVAQLNGKYVVSVFAEKPSIKYVMKIQRYFRLGFAIIFP